MKAQNPNTEVEQDLIALLTKESFGGLAVSLACAAILVFTFDLQSHGSFKAVWFYSFCALLIIRLITTLYWHKHHQRPDFNHKTYLRFTTFSIALIASMWGLYASVIIPNLTDVIELAFILTVFTGLSGGATTTLAANKTVCTFYISILLIPMSVSLMLNPVDYLGILAFTFALLILASGIHASNFTLEAARTKHLKDELVEKLATKNQQVIEANQALEQRVQQRTDELVKISNLDSLTKLKNRKAFSELLSKKFANSEHSESKFALFFVDLDGFKSINDVYGHKIGDQILKTVARRLKLSQLGEGELCRWGGDEFLALVDYQRDSQVKQVGYSIIHSLCNPIKCEVGEVSINATIGVAIYPNHGRNESELISHADIAMYEQKGQAKGEVLIFSEAMRDHIANKLKIKNAIPSAILNDEFYLVFHPVHSARTGDLLFAEALIRWNASGEFVSPADFIPVAEQYGLVHEIGRWVAQSVAQHLASCEDNADFKVSINVSVAELMTSGFSEAFSQIFKSQSVDLNRVVIEVTESVLDHDTEIMLSNLSTLRSEGFSIAIDDFGTGYSSLSQIVRLAPSIIKIDRSFVQRWDQGGETIVQAIQNVSEKMGFVTVVEGIETKEQEHLVLDTGVHYVQGFLYNKPMSFDTLLTAHISAIENRKLTPSMALSQDNLQQ